MDAVTILFYGDKTFTRTLETIPASQWLLPGACGVWSVKDIIAHLASYEHVLVEVLQSFQGGGAAPHLDRMVATWKTFNDDLVADVKDNSAEQVLDDYKKTCEQAQALARTLPADLWAKVGTLPWYGMEYSLDDYVVYAFYGHKREHSAQLDMFRDAHPAGA